MPFLVLDLEMSGPEAGWHEIIQLGAVLFDDAWNECGQYLSNVYPENEESFSQSSEKVHGLSLDDLEDAPMCYEVLPEFETWIIETLNLRKAHNRHLENAALLREVIICGQSVIYDIHFLKVAYREEKIKWGYSNKLLDLHTLSYFVFEVLKANGESVPRSLSLGAIAEYFGLKREEKTHNALEDALLTAACFKKVFSLGKTFQLAP